MARRKLKDARVLLTGASSGIGRALALELAAAGARQIVTARRQERLEELSEQLSGSTLIPVVGDVTTEDCQTRLLDTAREQLQGLDILINNAGVGAIGPFEEADEARLRRVMEVNFFAPAQLIRRALPMLKEGQRPLIVNISSVLGHRAVPKKSEYCASKFALHGLSDSLRAELTPQGIDVLLVSPSTTETEFFDNVLEDKAQLPWRKLGAMNARSVARKTVRAMRRGRHEIILTPGGKALVWCDRLAPGIVDSLVARLG